MESSLDMEQGAGILDEFFDEWLSFPTFDSFLAEQPEAISNPTTQANPQSQEKATTDATRLGVDYRHVGQSLSPTSDDTLTTNSANRKRRGHTKSRLGCISCKKRKIKCQETWPSCANCNRRGTPCRYPTIFKHAQHDRIFSEVINNPRQSVRLSDTPNMFSANDMRLFHHFLVAAYPCIPHEYETIWVNEIPMFSHQYEYLMHSILALSGSHLSIFVDNPDESGALNHRQRAIYGLEEAFTRWPPKANEAHAMLAASYLLAFQSSYMPDAFLDHILSLRGCALISQLIVGEGLAGVFHIAMDMNTRIMCLKLENFPRLDQPLAREILHSIAKFAPLLDKPDAQNIERALVAQLVESVRPLLYYIPQLDTSDSSTPDLTESSTETITSQTDSPFPDTSVEYNIKHPLLPSDLSLAYEDIHSWDSIADVPPNRKPDPLRSFNALMSTLLVFNTWPRESLLHLFSPTNKLGNIILAHFISIRFIIAPLSAPESAMRIPVRMMVEWCEKLIDEVEDDEHVGWTQYVEFPNKVLRCVQTCVKQNRGSTFRDIFEMLTNDPGAFKEGRARKF